MIFLVRKEKKEIFKLLINVSYVINDQTTFKEIDSL